MNDKCCRIVDENTEYDNFYPSNEDGSIYIDGFRDVLWGNMYDSDFEEKPTPPDGQAGWEPIIMYEGGGQSLTYRPLAPPKNTGLVTFDPLNCTNDQFITDPTRVADPKSASIDCQYCEDFGNAVGSPRGVSELGDVKGNKVNTGFYTCCNGNCDVRTNQIDVDHNIPYVLPQYVDQWGDDRFQLKWPDIYQGVKLSRLSEFATYKDRACSWELFPTMGEIPYDPSTSQYKNKRDHELALEKANQANRMAGNFIVFKIGPEAQSFDDSEAGIEWYKDQLEPCLGEFGYLNRFKDVIDVDLPTPEEFTAPYGFNDGTQNNVFIGRKKRTSWWKWDMIEAPVAWGLRQSTSSFTSVDYVSETVVDEETGEEYNKETSQWDHQFWIPPGDIWIAQINPDEPRNTMRDGQTEQDGQQRCPSGVKFMESGNMYVLPHDSFAVYISCNMYERFYDAYQSIKEIPTIRPQDRIVQAMYAATHPLIDKITVDLHKPYTINTEIKEYFSTVSTNEGGEPTFDISSKRTAKGNFANPYYQFMNWFDKKYMTSSNLNLVDSDEDLWNTLVSKYGSFYNAWTSEFDKLIKFDNQTLPPNTHIGLDLVYDFVVDGVNFQIKGRRNQPDVPNYQGMTNAGMSTYIEFGAGGEGSSLSINREFIERNKLLPANLEEDGVCHELSQPALFSRWSAFNDTIYRSEFLQSGWLSYETYYIRNGNGTSNPETYCRECDEYSSYANYASDKCDEANNCFCDQEAADNGGPCEGQAKNIEDWTIRDTRCYPVVCDNSATPISVAFHANGGIFYRGSSDSGIVRFGDQNNNLGEKQIRIKLTTYGDGLADVFSTALGFRVYSCDVYALQSSDSDTYLCERFPIVGQLQTPTINTDNEWPIQTKPPQNGIWETQPAYLPGLSTKYAPRLKKYGGFNKEEMEELFPYGVEYNLIPDYDKEGLVVQGVTYKYDSDNPFGCPSSDSLTLKNYVETKYDLQVQTARGLIDHTIAISEKGTFTGSRFKEDPFEPTETVPNKDYKRFKTYVQYSRSSLKDENGFLQNPDSDGVAWDGGGNWTLDWMPENSKGKTYNLSVRLANPYLSKMLDTAGNEGNRNFYPPSDNIAGDYDDLFASFAYCDTQDQWFGFGDQTSRVTITVTASPKPLIAKFALFPPSPVECFDRVEFTKDGQVKPTDQKGVIPTSYKNQLQRSSGRSLLPKLTFNNIVDWENGEQPYNKSESFLINERQSKSLAALFRKVKDFSENRKFKIVLATRNGKFFQLDGVPTRYESQGKTYEGFGHFVQVVRDGSDYNTYLPGSIPIVQKKTLEDVTWVTKPNTRFTASINNALEEFDSTWPLNLRITHGYTVDPLKGTLTFPGTRMFFALFPKVETITLSSPSMDSVGDPPIGSVVNFLTGPVGTYYKYGDAEGSDFQGKYVIFNPSDYTWQRYSDLHYDFNNTSHIGYVYNSILKIDPLTFHFYREPTGDRTKKAEAICTEMRLKSYFVDARGKRVAPGTLTDPCIDVCTDGGITFIRTETELQFKNQLSADWYEIDDLKTEILSSHIYKPECVNNEKDFFLSNKKYRSKWADLKGFDGIILDHSEEEQFVSKYYPPTRYDNIFYKMIVDNDNQSEISVSRGEERHHSIVPFGNKGSAPFRFNIHQKYNVDYGNGFVNSAEISGVHNYFPFMDINDKDWGLGYTPLDKFFVPEAIDQDFDGLVKPNLVEKVEGTLGTYDRIRPDKQIILTIPADATVTETIEFATKPDTYVISDTLRADTPLFYLGEIDQEDNVNCEGDLDRLIPDPYQGRSYGKNFGGALDIGRPYDMRKSKIPLENWAPDSPFALWTRYCDIDPETCESQKCITAGRGQTALYGTYKMSNPTKLTFGEIAKGQDFLAFISYNAGIVNGMNGIRPPKILRSIHSKEDNPTVKNDILYSKEYPDKCNDRVVLPPEYQYPDWDVQVNSTFLQGVQDLEKLSSTYAPAKELLEADLLAEEMVFRALYGEKELVNRTSFNGDTLLTSDQILNYVDPQIDVAEMHDQILWSYDRGSNSDVSRVQTQHTFSIRSRARTGDRASVKWGGVTVEADITDNSTNTWSGRLLNLKISSSAGVQQYSVPIYVSNVVFSEMISVLAGSEEPTVGDDSTISLLEQGAVVQPERKTRYIDCYGKACCISREDWIAEDVPGFRDIIDISCKNMGTWKFFLLQVPRLERYNWNDTYNVCEEGTFTFGPDTEACKPYNYGYCNVTPEECPPCTGEHPPERQVLVDSLDKEYYVTENTWVNNYLDTDVERFRYSYKDCRNTISSNGHFYKHNFFYHPDKQFRLDLALQYKAAEYAVELATIPCLDCSSGGCTCSDPNAFAGGGDACQGVCDYAREVVRNPEGPCNTECRYTEPRVSLGSDCFCNGFPQCPAGADPDGCFPYGNTACHIRFSYPTTLTPNEACEKAFNLSQYDSSYWGYFGYGPNGEPRGCGRACYPRGHCNTPYFCAIQDCEKCPQSNDGATVCYDGIPPQPTTYTFGRVVASPQIAVCGLRPNGLTATAPSSNVCEGGNSSPCPDFSAEDVFETKVIREYREPEVAYDTYLKDTFYGGNGPRICNSGAKPDCITELFSVVLNNDQVQVNFFSGEIAWAPPGPIGSERCVGPTLQTTYVPLCVDTNYRITESNSDLEVEISDNIGYIANYEKTDTIGCTNNVKINMEPQSQDWAIKEIDGECMVGNWLGQHINESLLIWHGINGYAICQSDQVPGSPCLGELSILNASETFNSPPGGECPEENVQARTYAVCEGTLAGADCNSPDECSWGESAWFEELEVVHNEYRKRMNEANISIPKENIIQGLVPGSIGPLQTKTYQVPGGTVTRANKGPYGVTTEDMYVYVTVAFYTYKYRCPHNIKESIAEARNAKTEEETGVASTAKCFQGRPFTTDPSLTTLSPLSAYFYHCNFDNTGNCGGLNQINGNYFPWYVRATWLFQPGRLQYRCVGRGAGYPNWYTPAVSPHGCRPQFDQYYGRYDTPPRNFLVTTPTVERKACQGRYTCYYNDKQWPAGENDYYGLSGQGTFLQCHKYLGKFWVYDYFQDSPI